MAKNWPVKDPQDVLDYGFNWSPLIAQSPDVDDDDQIASTTAIVIEGTVEVESHDVGNVPDANDGQGTVTWLSGGTAGETCLILMHIVTVGTREIDQTMKIKIKER